MSAAEVLTPVERVDRASRRREGAIAVALLGAAAAFVALWPFAAVIEAGSWSMTAVALIIAVAAVGGLVRSLAGRHPAVWSLLAQIVAIVLLLTLLAMPEGALFGMVPTSTTGAIFARHAADALDAVAYGTAPLEATSALRTVIGLGFGTVAILLDQLIALRAALPAIVLVAAVGALPMIITLGDADVAWFVLFAVLALFLLRHAAGRDPDAPRRASTGAVVSLGAAAIVATLVIAPVLPVSATWIGAGSSVRLDPSLRLGDDLRRPVPFTVLTLATEASTAPYLRIATLSSFDGEEWTADEGDAQPLADGFGDDQWRAEFAAEEPQRTSVRVNGITGAWLPVPYPATRISGVSPGWQIMPDNRTVVSSVRDAADEDYTVTTATIEPTLEQIRATPARPSAGGSPAELPPIIAEAAAEVTAGAASDYDALVALQDWFRSEFSYSLDAPVDGGFDGTGADAVAAFLDERSGYCIHFAGAFALMAESLDMQVRIVVGYLPGARTDETRDEETIFTVRSDQLHAWPEVRFDGIGWVPFEPTATLGVPTEFAPAEVDEDAGGGGDAPEATVAPSAAPTSAAEVDRDEGDMSTADGDALERLDPTPVVLVAGAVLIVLLLPALLRLLRRGRRRAAAARGDAASAWREVRDVLVDLRMPVSSADSPRARGAGLIETGADPDAVRTLVDAVERRSYAASPAAPGDLSAALHRVSADLHRAADGRTRARAVLIPRSLFVADGSRSPLLV